MSGEVRNFGEVPIPVDRKMLNIFFWVFAGSLTFYLVFFNDNPIPAGRLGETLLLLSTILLPTWLWVSNQTQGLPIMPFYALSFFPTYAVPLCRGDSRLVQYTELEIANVVFTITGYLLLTTLIAWQCTNRNLRPPPKVRAIKPAGARNLMLCLLLAGILFELYGALFGQSLGGAYQAFRGYAQNGSRLAVFVLFYQLGRGQLNKGTALFMCLMVAVLVIRQAASIVLANAFPVLGLAFAGFFLGSGKIPWKSLVAVVGMIILLHSGKAEMRAKYYQEGVKVELKDYPGFFAEWMGKGVVGLTKGTSTEGVEVQSAKERSALLPLFLQIQKMTPDQVPYLEGASYEYLPSMLIPRVLSKEKAVAHISNMIMAVHYGILKVEDVWFTSIGFDLPMEAYANYGLTGVAGLAVLMGLFLGIISLLTTGVPLFSFRFLMAILILSAIVGSNNTLGVFVTTAWQGFLALFSLSFVIMQRIPNPLFVNPSLKRDPKGHDFAGSFKREAGREEKAESEIRKAETELVKHERPRRFIYGEKKK